MSHERLLEVLTRLYPLSHELTEALKKELIPLSLPKNYILIEAPRTPEYAYFIDSGFAMSYFYAKGKRHIQHFWSGGEIMMLPSSFFEQLPSAEHVELATDCDLLCITLPSVLKLFQEFPETNIIYRKIMTRCLEDLSERFFDIRNLSAPERFKKILKRFPDIEQIVSQEDLASYLSITPQSLSRIKRNT